jgi:predicted nucleic acid-binding protein
MASRRVFWDTSFFFALVAKRDPAHRPAVVADEKLLKTGGRVVTTDYVVDETFTLTKACIDARTALGLLDRMERSESIDLEPLTGGRFLASKQYFRKHSDHGYSFTDCTSFVVMDEFEIRAALTTDRHFKEAGFEVLLPTTCRPSLAACGCESSHPTAWRRYLAPDPRETGTHPRGASGLVFSGNQFSSSDITGTHAGATPTRLGPKPGLTKNRD